MRRPAIPTNMRVCEYSATSPSGIRMLDSKPTPASVSSPGFFGTPGNVVVKVHAFGVNPVDAKYIIGDKLPESWMDWSARRMTGHTPGFDFSGEVALAPPNCPYKVGDEVR